jgi:hypothetical protein
MTNQQEPIRPGSDPDPASPHHAPVKTATEARSGVTLGRMRWVLYLSLAAIVVVLLIVWAVIRH